MAGKKDSGEIVVTPLQKGSLKLRVLGTTPLYQNRMSAKVRQGLLVGTKRKTAVEKLGIKHHPIDEFRNSAERTPAGPTELGIVTTAIKAAMSDAALETAGITKTSTQRLISVPAGHFALYGTPKLKIDIVRSADINRTPDMRTRCYVPRWGAEIHVSYIAPQFTASSVVNLLCNAGVLIGIGDFRQQKGKGSYGSFRVIGTGDKDAEWDDLVANHGKEAQAAAINSPECADIETQELLDFYYEELARRDS